MPCWQRARSVSAWSPPSLTRRMWPRPVGNFDAGWTDLTRAFKEKLCHSERGFLGFGGWCRSSALGEGVPTSRDNWAETKPKPKKTALISVTTERLQYF